MTDTDVVLHADELSRVAADVGRGLTLPADWYTSKQIHDLEQSRIFSRSWQYIGRTDQVERHGDYFTATVAGVPVVVVRNAEGDVAGFVNVCRHRCAEVVLGAGSRNVLQCHYHAWTYDLGGHLISAPRSGREPDFDPTRFDLAPIRVEQWGPLIFANLALSGPSLGEQLGELPARMAMDGLDWDAINFVERTVWEVEANWKVVVENFDECYHCPVAHPSFSRLMEVDADSYHLESGEWWQRAVTRLRPSAATATDLAYDPSGGPATGQFAFLWPNFGVAQVPGPPNLTTLLFEPVGPERTSVVSDYFFGPQVGAELARQLVAFNVDVGAEDQHLVESVQRGLRSGRVRQGRLIVDSEALIQHFQHLVATELSVGS